MSLDSSVLATMMAHFRVNRIQMKISSRSYLVLQLWNRPARFHRHRFIPPCSSSSPSKQNNLTPSTTTTVSLSILDEPFGRKQPNNQASHPSLPRPKMTPSLSQILKWATGLIAFILFVCVFPSSPTMLHPDFLSLKTRFPLPRNMTAELEDKSIIWDQYKYIQIVSSAEELCSAVMVWKQIEGVGSRAGRFVLLLFLSFLSFHYLFLIKFKSRIYS